ncbi:MAG: hypothetical protein AAGA30_16960 [Planctomycetota bacterium]
MYCFKFIIAVSLLAGFSEMLLSQTYEPFRPEKGIAHPEFQLREIESGEVIRLSDFRDKKLVVFHFASW